MATPLAPACRRRRATWRAYALMLGLGLASTGCTALRPARTSPAAGARDLEVHFATERSVAGTEVNAAGSRALRLDRVTRVRGRAAAVRGDTLVLHATWWRGPGVWHEHDLATPVIVAVSLAGGDTRVYERHVSLRRTLLGFGAPVAIWLVVGALIFATDED